MKFGFSVVFLRCDSQLFFLRAAILVLEIYVHTLNLVKFQI